MIQILCKKPPVDHSSELWNPQQIGIFNRVSIAIAFGCFHRLTRRRSGRR